PRTNKYDQEHREVCLDPEEIVVDESPNAHAETAAAFDQSARQPQEAKQRPDDLGLLLEQAPQADDEDQKQRRDPRHDHQDAYPAALELRANALPRDRPPPPGVARQRAFPVLIALIEDRHSQPSKAPRRVERNSFRLVSHSPTALKNTSSKLLRC